MRAGSSGEHRPRSARRAGLRQHRRSDEGTGSHPRARRGARRRNWSPFPPIRGIQVPAIKAMAAIVRTTLIDDVIVWMVNGAFWELEFVQFQDGCCLE